LHSNDDKESMAAMESELEQFNVASLSHDNTVEPITSGKNKLFIKKKICMSNVLYKIDTGHKKVHTIKSLENLFSNYKQFPIRQSVFLLETHFFNVSTSFAVSLRYITPFI